MAMKPFGRTLIVCEQCSCDDVKIEFKVVEILGKTGVEIQSKCPSCGAEDNCFEILNK